MEPMQHKTFEAELKEFDEKDLTVTHFISTERRDRGGDILLADGMVMEGRPVVLHTHGYGPMGQEPIAKPLSIGKGDFKGRKGITAKTQFFPDETGKRLFAKTTHGFMPSWSIGWRPIKWEMQRDNDTGEVTRLVKKWELLEYSLVGVPMQPDAQTIDGGKGQGNIMFKMLPAEEEQHGEIAGWQKEDGSWEEKPYPNEHACRIQDPKKYARIRRQNDKFGKGIHAIWGIPKDGGTELQALRFSKSNFSAEEAKKWAKDHDYTCKPFEAASGKSDNSLCDIDTGDGKGKGKNSCKCDSCGHVVDWTNNCHGMTCIKCNKGTLKTIKKDVDSETKQKAAIPYQKTKLASEGDPWNGIEESKKAKVECLKEMAVWFDHKNPEKRSSYKGIHHKGDHAEHACSWKAVRALASNLMNARGGIHIPNADLKLARAHCEAHYADFGKGDPPWKKKEGLLFIQIMEEVAKQKPKEGENFTLDYVAIEEKKYQVKTPDDIFSLAKSMIPEAADFFDPAYKQDDWNNGGADGEPNLSLTDNESVDIQMVDGDEIRKNNRDVDFTMGGHHYVYPELVPEENRIIIDSRMKDDDILATKCHEFIERELMKYYGMEYNPAHEIANIGEGGVRHILADEEDGGHAGNGNDHRHYHQHGGDHIHNRSGSITSLDWEKDAVFMTAEISKEAIAEISDVAQKKDFKALEEIAKKYGLTLIRIPSEREQPGPDGKVKQAATLPEKVEVFSSGAKEKEALEKMSRDLSAQVTAMVQRLNEDTGKAAKEYIDKLKGRVN